MNRGGHVPTWSSLRLLADLYIDITFRWPYLIGKGWARDRGWIR